MPLMSKFIEWLISVAGSTCGGQDTTRYATASPNKNEGVKAATYLSLVYLASTISLRGRWVFSHLTGFV